MENSSLDQSQIESSASMMNVFAAESGARTEAPCGMRLGAAPQLVLTCATAFWIACSPAPTAAKADSNRRFDGEASCQEATIDRINTADALRSLADKCKAVTLVAIKALNKLNTLPLPTAPTVISPRGNYAAQTQWEQSELTATLFFGLGETYPTDEGFEALARLIRTVNKTEAVIRSVAILGSVDAAEADTPLSRGLARGRAEILYRYLVAAGISRSIIRVVIQPTADGLPESPKATDRSALVTLIVERPVEAVKGEWK